jgi:gliding motility-associated protein GldM
MNTQENNPSREENLKASFKAQKRKRLLRFSVVTLALVLSLAAWYYTHYRVPAPLIQKFVLINSALEHSLLNYKRKSDESLQTLKRDVKKSGNPRKGLELIKRAELLKKKTSEITGEISRIKRLLIEKAGDGLDERTHTTKLTEAKLRVSQLMVGIIGSPKGEAYALEKKLNDYSHWLNKEYKDLLKKPLPMLTKSPKNFVYDNFWQTPVVVAGAKLTQLMHQVMNNQINILTQLHALRPSSEELRFDQVYTGVTAESNVLRSGDTYRATMLIAAIPSKIKAKMTVNGKPIKVEKGIGKVRFKTTYPLGRKYWEGTVTFKSKGRDTTFRIKHEYIVVPRMK